MTTALTSSTDIPNSSSSQSSSSVFQSLRFDNRNLRLLPMDTGPAKISRRVSHAVFCRAELQPLLRPVVASLCASACALLGLPQKELQEYSPEEREEIAQCLAGNKLIPGSEPAAHVYCGFQFGSFAGQLGDGAAMYLGEVLNKEEQRWELQLKGSGLTPCSRSADGRKVLRSSLREYLCSEAMHSLRVPSTRAGAFVVSESTVERDPYYDGRAAPERCAVVTRIAPTFYRFGSLEIFRRSAGEGEREGPSAGDAALHKRLVDHILLYFPHIDGDSVEKYTQLLLEIARLTALLSAGWQAVGFTHGVLNTDNMSILGLTIDYGPFGFMEHFDPEYTPNGSDHSARYSFGKQPEVCRWNIQRLAEAMQPLVTAEAAALAASLYDQQYAVEYNRVMGLKLGLIETSSTATRLSESLLAAMTATHADYTDTFVALTEMVEELTGVAIDAAAADEAISAAVAAAAEKIASRCATPEERQEQLARKLRVHRPSIHPQQLQQILTLLEAQPEMAVELFGGAPLEAVKAEMGAERRKVELSVKASTELQRWKDKPATSATATALRTRAASVWKTWLAEYLAALQQQGDYRAAARIMRENNPTFILRAWVAQRAIEAAEKEDYTKVNTVLRMLQRPYSPEYSIYRATVLSTGGGSDTVAAPLTEVVREFVVPPPAGADALLCTCSS